jgi:dTMP kinase
MKKGAYIILEGGEGCGKSTQAKLLNNYFNQKGFSSIITREPGGVGEAEQIRAILLRPQNNLGDLTELFLYEAARTEVFRQKIIPSLEKGITVIADRSGYSTKAYQGYAGGVDLELIEKLNNLSTFGINPDLAFIIDIEAKLGLEREENIDRFGEKGADYHEKVNQGYLEIAKEDPEKFVVIPYVDGGEGKMQEEIRYHIKDRFGI